MALINFKTKKPITEKEMREYIMKTRGWTRAEYKKEYDKYRNRVRNYEIASGRVTVERETTGTGKTRYTVTAKAGERRIDPLETMYLQERSREKYGADYYPSRLYRDIENTPSTSTGAVRRHAVELQEGKRNVLFSQRQEEEQKERLRKDFAGLIEKSPIAKEIAYREGATAADISRGLRQYAEELHKKQAEMRKQNKNAPFSTDPGTP